MTRPKTRKLSHDDYKIGWICALACEMAAAKAMLDEFHEDLPKRGVDNNAYTLGSFGVHNVVIACLPSGCYGTTSAATVATQLLNSFQSVKFGVLVGIGGGVPGEEMDIGSETLLSANQRALLEELCSTTWAKQLEM